jgi:predicted DNA-binding transcriptional regulator AlpA
MGATCLERAHLSDMIRLIPATKAATSTRILKMDIVRKVAPGDRFLRGKQVWEKLGIGKSKFYDMIDKEELPKPIPLGPKTSVWLHSEVEEWMQRRVNAVCGVSQ